MYEIGSTCTSQCSNCGVLCEAFPISDVTSLQLYSTQGCTVVVGDLYILSLPLSIRKKQLLGFVQTIQSIRGSLYVLNNLYLAAMTPFSGLKSIQGDVYYLNNPILVDTRMPSLSFLGGSTIVNGCDRLCPARYTSVGSSSIDASCPNNTITAYLHVNGNVNDQSLPILCSTVGNAISHILNNQVFDEITMSF